MPIAFKKLGDGAWASVDGGEFVITCSRGPQTGVMLCQLFSSEVWIGTFPTVQWAMMMAEAVDQAQNAVITSTQR